MDPLWLEYAHLLGAILIFGTGLGTAFHMWRAHLTGDPRVIAAVARSTVLADWLFTAPAVMLQPVTGAMLAWSYGWSLLEPWLLTSLGLYALAGGCWLPVVWLQSGCGGWPRRRSGLASHSRRGTGATPGPGSRSAGRRSRPCSPSCT